MHGVQSWRSCWYEDQLIWGIVFVRMRDKPRPSIWLGLLCSLWYWFRNQNVLLWEHTPKAVKKLSFYAPIFHWFFLLKFNSLMWYILTDAMFLLNGTVNFFIPLTRHRLSTLEVANEKISSLNQISERNYQSQAENFRQNIRMLGNMKKELDSVFRRIRWLLQG